MITHAEVRAVALSKLRIGPGVLWDLGAGSGSVGIEAAGLCPGVTVYAVERNGNRCTQIKNNIRCAGVNTVQVVQGDTQEVIKDLPPPRSIFAGGGGQDIAKIVVNAFAALRHGGRLVVAAVLLDTKARLNHLLGQHLVEVIEIEVRRSAPVAGSVMLKPENPVTLFVFQKA